MKTKLLMTTLLMNLSVLNAQEVKSESQFAVLKPNKTCQIHLPQGVNASESHVYFSKDCSTAYVLPSTTMKKTVLKPYLTADAGICNRYKQVVTSMSGIEAKITKLDTIIEKLGVQLAEEKESKDIEVIKEKLTYFSKQQAALKQEQVTRLKPFYDTAAVRTQIKVESDVMDEVAALQAANIANVGDSYPTKFVPAQITSGILAITTKDADTYRGRSVLKVSFPGPSYVYNKEDGYQPNDGTTLVNMNGSISGIIDLSAVTYCSALDEINQSVSANEQNLIDVFTTAVALNYDFRVRVQAGIRIHMKSTIETLEFLKDMQAEIRNSKFRRDEFLGAIVSGGVMDGLDIQLDDKGEHLQLSKIIFGDEEEHKDETKNIVAPLIGKFIKTHLEKIEAKLQQLGVLTTLDTIPAKEIAAGTTTEIGGYQSICSSSSSLFGLVKRSSCHSQPVYVQVDHDGISRIIQKNIDNSKMESEVNIETNETVLVRHTSTFGIK